METALKIENLTKVYKKDKKKVLHAVTDVNIELKTGDIYAFIGPNGAGKTTTIKVLVGLLYPTSGSAKIYGFPSYTVEAKSKMGYLPEISYYYMFLEAKALLGFYASLWGLAGSEKDKKIDEILDLVNLKEFKNVRLQDYSKGMLQRFGIAQALVCDPPLLIFDELTSGLDPIGQKEVKDIVKDLKTKGKTIFFSSHRLTEVEEFCDYIGIINKSKIVKQGKIEDIKKLAEISRYYLNFEIKDTTDIDVGEKLEIVGENIYRVLIPKEKLNNGIEKILSKGGSILKVLPLGETLEEIFCKLIEE